MPYVDMKRDSDGIQWVEKTVAGLLDFSFDWAGEDHGTWSENWLQPGEIIVDHTITVPTGITLVSSSLTIDKKAILVWLTGGSDCTSYDVVGHIATSNAPREDERVMRVKVRLKR